VRRAAGNVQPQPKVGPFREKLDRLLEENIKRPRRERLTLVRIYEELRNQGYDGGYDAVRRYATGAARGAGNSARRRYRQQLLSP